MDPVFLDFETFYSKDYSLKQMTTREYIMDPRFEIQCVTIAGDDDRAPEFVPGNQVASRLAQIDWSTKTLVAHNAQFDAAVMAWRLNLRPARYACTMSMARGLLSGRLGSFSLASLAAWFGLPAKDSGALLNVAGVRLSEMHPESETTIRWRNYAVQDTASCRELWRRLRPDMPDREMDVVDLVIRMYVEGDMRLDRTMVAEWLVDEEAKLEALLAAVGRTKADLSSRERFADMLRWLGVDPPMKVSSRTGAQTYAFAASDAGMQQLLDHEDERVSALCQARLAVSSTIDRTRGHAFLRLADIPGSFLQAPLLYSGAHTHRFSGQDGINLQNLPRGGTLRKAIMASPGRLLAVADASQIEARLVAWMAGQDDLLQEFAEGKDTYSSFASYLYGYPVNKAEHPAERHVGKLGILSLGYGAGAETFYNMARRSGVNLDFAFCEEVVSRYRERYSSIRSLWRSMDTYLRELIRGTSRIRTGAITLERTDWGARAILPSGLAINYPSLRLQDGEMVYWSSRYKSDVRIYGAKVVENLCQALARIKITDAMRVIRRLRPEWKLTLQVHDELVYSVPMKDAPLAVEALCKALSSDPGWSASMPPIPLAAEGGYGVRYGEVK
jgi:DNA polymerase